MKVNKRILATVPKVYSICKVPASSSGGEPSFLAASETNGPALFFKPPVYKPQAIAEEPGGFISLWSFEVDGRPYVVASTQFKPGFDAANCDIRVYPLDQGERPEPVKIFPLPYTHRVAVIEIGGERVFVASTLCAKKDSREDWSHPGGIFAARIPAPLDAEWKITPVFEGLNKNHGMDLAQIDPSGRRGFLISAMEGCFFLTIPRTPSESWGIEQIDSEETSDAYAFDWDGDGHPQVFAIQPFHGNRVSVFRKQDEKWTKSVLTDEIEFGHVLWAGPLLDRRAVIVGCRGGSRDLAVYWKTGPGDEDCEREVIDRDIGPAQMAVHHDGDREFLVVSGHGVDSVILYELNR